MSRDLTHLPCRWEQPEDEAQDAADPSQSDQEKSLQEHYDGTILAKRVETKTNPVDANAEKDNSSREPSPIEVIMKAWDWITNPKHTNAIQAIFTILIFGATFAYAVVAILQWCTMRGQLTETRITRQHTEAMQSARLVIENFHPVVTQEGGNLNAKGSYSLRNVGGSAAIDITAPPPQVSTSVEFPNYHVTQPMWGGPYLPIGPTLGAGGTSDPLGSFDDGTDRKSVLDGRVYFSLLIVVGYRNVFGEQLIATECRVYSPSEKDWQSCNPAPQP